MYLGRKKISHIPENRNWKPKNELIYQFLVGSKVSTYLHMNVYLQKDTKPTKVTVTQTKKNLSWEKRNSPTFCFYFEWELDFSISLFQVRFTKAPALII